MQNLFKYKYFIFIKIIFLGARFAIYQSKLGIIKVIENHAVEVSEKMHVPYEFQPGAFILEPKNGIHLKIKRC